MQTSNPAAEGLQMPHQEETISLAEEELHVEKRQVSTGKVRIHTKTDTVEEVARASLEQETVEVSRIPVDRDVDVAPPVRTEGNLTIVPVVEEVLVIEKRLILKEELHIRRHVSHEDVEVPIALRKQRAVVERVTAEGQIRTDQESEQ